MLYYILCDKPTNDMLYDMLCSVAYEERKDVFSQLCEQQLQTLPWTVTQNQRCCLPTTRSSNAVFNHLASPLDADVVVCIAEVGTLGIWNSTKYF